VFCPAVNAALQPRDEDQNTHFVHRSLRAIRAFCEVHITSLGGLYEARWNRVSRLHPDPRAEKNRRNFLRSSKSLLNISRGGNAAPA
jgi:hypothetical protein